MNHVSVSPTNGNGPTQGQRKTLTRVGIEKSHGFLYSTSKYFLTVTVRNSVAESLSNILSHCKAMGFKGYVFDSE